MTTGTIIVLNGTVSAGKSSIARAVQHVMAEPYIHLGADILGAMCPLRPGGRYIAEPLEGLRPGDRTSPARRPAERGTPPRVQLARRHWPTDRTGLTCPPKRGSRYR
ncbi:MAG: hypothetical protein AB7R89_32795 [Dehalococcoidia bacterium]